MDANTVRFIEEDDGVIVEINGVPQSYVDVEDPTKLIFPYMERMADFLDQIAPSGQRYRVVHVGGAGMSLARYVSVTRPTSPQIVLEPDEALTAAVREKLPLPLRSGIKVRPLDGRAGIAGMRDDFAQVIIVDAFSSASVPKELVGVEFFAEIKRVLTPDGLLLMNVIDQRPFDWTRRVVAGLAWLFKEVVVGAEPRIFNQPRFGNLLLGASQSDIPLDDIKKEATKAIWPYRYIGSEKIGRFIAGAEAFTDADAEPSPVASKHGILRFS